VVEQLKDLAMDRARFEVAFARDENGGPEGTDRAEFLFSANPGQPPRPLARIASGGEISRLMLGLRSVLRRGHEGESGVPIVIFDEVDTGIGGRTAEAVGQKMREIAGAHQVFCITHLPQIAKRADHHYRVQKSSGAESTRVDVVPLNEAERVAELARMMGEESAANLAHARAMLAEIREAA
jgi:DNA repair protein RecN (Recombination protein N)